MLDRRPMNLPHRDFQILRALFRGAVVVALSWLLAAVPPSPLVSSAGPGRRFAAPPQTAALRPEPLRGPARQPRPHGVRALVEPRRVRVIDGDTVHIRWSPRDLESVRILGIDTPEIRDPSRGRFYDQPFGRAARRFARRAFGGARKVEILRAVTLDSYGRTLAYLFLDGRNYSVLVIASHLAEETVSRNGSNGFPREAAAVRAAARKAGPPPFESPRRYRGRTPEPGARDSLPRRSAGSGRVLDSKAEATVIVEDRTRGESPCL